MSTWLNVANFRKKQIDSLIKRGHTPEEVALIKSWIKVAIDSAKVKQDSEVIVDMPKIKLEVKEAIDDRTFLVNLSIS